MRGPKPPVVELSAEERQGLKGLVRAYWTPQQLAVRARIVLAAAEGHNNTEIARRLEVDTDTVRLWRMRWLGLQAVSLENLSPTERTSKIAEALETSMGS